MHEPSANSTTNPDGEAIIQAHWPFDGPHAPQRSNAATDATSQLVRYLNNATSIPDGLGAAPQVYTTLGGLARTAGDLPQLFSQLERWARHAATDTTLAHDTHRAQPERSAHAAGQAATATADRLHQASAQAALLYETLATARTELAHLYHTPTPLAEEDATT